MILVKLDAINSTSTYLKELSQKSELQNWTVVTAEYQRSGRGQMKTKWISDKGKNLICSILIRFEDLKIKNQFYLNCAISSGLYKALECFNLPSLKIKWPNDIMSASKKIGGILIENSLNKNQIYQSVVGIGLNINQEIFPRDLPDAISMRLLLDQKIDRDLVLHEIIKQLKEQIEILNNKEFQLLHNNYEKFLFKMNRIHTFEDNHLHKFVGKLIGVSKQGMLRIELDDKEIKTFNFKEIKFL